MQTAPKPEMNSHAWSRRRLIGGVAALGTAGMVAAGATGRAAETELYRAKNNRVRQSEIGRAHV